MDDVKCSSSFAVFVWILPALGGGTGRQEVATVGEGAEEAGGAAGRRGFYCHITSCLVQRAGVDDGVGDFRDFDDPLLHARPHLRV